MGTRNRGGLTLLELLVVIAILVTVTAAAIPMVVPAVESRRMREAARGVSTFLAKARADAIASGRPVGVYFSPSVGSAGSEASETLIQVEVPPPFGGYTTNAALKMTGVSPIAGDPPNRIRFDITLGTAQWDTSDPPQLIFTAESIPPDSRIMRVGDTLQVNCQGYEYTIDGPGDWISGTNSIQAFVDLPPGAIVPWPIGTTSPPLPYKITRQPQPSSSQPFTLPTGAVVDLYHSGVGPNTFASRPVRIMFSPTGAIDRIYYPNGDWFRPSLPVHFLIGKSENLPIADNGGKHNYLDLQNFWVTVGNQTGQVVTSEMATSTSTDPIQQIIDARAFARDGQGMGGN